MAEYSDIINGVDSSLESFDKEALKAQKRIMEKIQLLAKDLEVDSAGNIKTTIANLKKINSIKAEISRIVCDDRYKEAVTKFCESFQKVYDRQNKYYKEHFAEATLSETAAKKQKLLGQMAIDNTIEGLTGAGVNAQITDKLTDMLKRSVTSGALWTDMVAEMRSYLDPDGDGTGAFAKYAKTYATTAMGQFTGQNNKLMTDALDTEWYMYVGSDIETTREFCQHLTKKKYIHVSEIPEILKGHIDGHDCAIYAKTGLPQGMIEGTTPENFQVNVGGWNCRHQLLPVAEEAVPEDIRRKFQQAQEEQAQTDFEKWMAMHQSFFNQYQKELLLTGNDLQNPRLKSMSMDDLEELFEYGYKVDVKNCQRNINSWRVKIQDVIDEAQKINAEDVASEARSLMSKYSLSSFTPDGYDRAENGGFNADYKKLIEKLNEAKKNVSDKEDTKQEDQQKIAEILKKNGIDIDPSLVHVEDGHLIIDGAMNKALAESMKASKKDLEQIGFRWHEDGIHENGYIGSSNSFDINAELRSAWTNGAEAIHGDPTKASRANRPINWDDDLLTIKALDDIIAGNSLPFAVKAYRTIDEYALSSMFGTEIYEGGDVMAQIQALKSKAITSDPAFMSASLLRSKNVRGGDIQLELDIPAGHPMYVSKNFMESECILGRDTQLEFVSVRMEGRKTIVSVKVKEGKKEAPAKAIKEAETHIEQVKGKARTYIHDDKNLSISERAKNYAEALKLYAGRSGDAPELGYSLNLARSGDVRFLATKATKQDPVMVMNLDIINQHAELMGANLASIPTAWRGRFNDLIRRINATDIGEKGYVACKAEIQEAYNIYKLSTNKTAIKYGLEKISTKMPVEVVEKFKKIFDGGKMPDKEFFDMLDTYIPLIPKAVRGQEGYYSPSDKVVVISPTASDKVRLEGSKWFREALFYHEYGHAKDHISIAGKWRTDVRWTTLFDKFARRINQDGGKSIQAAFDKKYEELGGRRNISRNDQEMMGALADTLQAMVSDHRYFDHMGHSRSYFASKDSQLAEFIAHASENRWMGNPYFREIFPDLYQEMIDLCNEMYRR